MVVGRARRPPERREQLVVAHQAQHAIAADRQTQTIVQAGPDFAVAFAGKRRGGEVGLDRSEQAGVIDRWLGAARFGRHGLGLPVGRNRVLRLMRDNQLLSPYRRPPRPANDP